MYATPTTTTSLRFLPWPKEALVSVSQGLIRDFPIECTPEVKDRLMVHMGMVHQVGGTQHTHTRARTRARTHTDGVGQLARSMQDARVSACVPVIGSITHEPKHVVCVCVCVE